MEELGDRENVILVEGSGDLLAAHHMDDRVLVAPLGSNFHDDRLPSFRCGPIPKLADADIGLLGGELLVGELGGKRLHRQPVVRG